ISHPNVVRVYDSGEQDGIPYLVMECLPGTSLVDELAWGVLDPRRARRVGLDVLGALDAAHRLGVVHRDVKPGNILLTAPLEGPVKVSDFGIATSGEDQSGEDSSPLAGTPAYLAPERVAGEPAGPVSDLYSLGVVLYESLAGRRPYEAETSLAIALAIHMGEGADLAELRPDLDPALVAIIDTALARDPAQRWASAAEMAEALRAWNPRSAARAMATSVVAPETAAGEVAGGPQVGDGPAARDRRRTGIVCAGAAGVLLVVLIGMAALRSPGRAEPSSPPPSSLAESPNPTLLPETSILPPPSSTTKPTRRTTLTTLRRAAATTTTAAPRPTPTTRRATTTTARPTPTSATTTPTTSSPPTTTAA
ncbi:MAG: serine/threonine-protein kinase, partial [Acidimicrobiales bacterium]